MSAATTTQRELTERQTQLLTFIRESFCAEQRVPSIRQCMAHMGVKSPNAIAGHLLALARKGYIGLPNHEARSIRLLGVKVLLVPEEAQ